ncbi:MAG: glycosyltransferase family 1 protein [Candidatus Electrothrix sp. AR4]|nr:glycosyltransferase family 1 protein [Candidatus Electrothrix sp. AR4]
MSKRLRCLSEIYFDRPGSQTIHAFNRSLKKAGVPLTCHHPNQYVTNLARGFDDRGWGRNLRHFSRNAYLVAMMWPKMARLLPVGCWAEVIPLCFDCWPADYQKWERVFRRFRVKTACFTARQSVAYFQKTIPTMDSLWVPEAADAAEYAADIPLKDRQVDVLELGRRSEAYHDAVTWILQERGYAHLYVQGRKRMFPTREQLMETWRQTKISICFPKSVTAPERSGGLETVTFRYLESIASKCLLVGHCPRELYDIFGYNPVIEADAVDYGGQLLGLLENIGKYQELLERNYLRMLEVGTWDARVQTILSLLREREYVVEAA